MSLRHELWKEDSGEAGQGLAQPRKSMLTKVGIGMAAGLIIPFALLLQAFVFPGWRVVGLIALFGPAFGGAMGYFLHRLQRVERSHGEPLWVLLSGALAGGFTASLAHEFEYLASPWGVPGGFVAGAVVAGLLWWRTKTW